MRHPLIGCLMRNKLLEQNRYQLVNESKQIIFYKIHYALKP